RILRFFRAAFRAYIIENGFEISASSGVEQAGADIPCGLPFPKKLRTAQKFDTKALSNHEFPAVNVKYRPLFHADEVKLFVGFHRMDASNCPALDKIRVASRISQGFHPCLDLRTLFPQKLRRTAGLCSDRIFFLGSGDPAIKLTEKRFVFLRIQSGYEFPDPVFSFL
ncbi:MAG: hypothetical protein PUB93_05320, partial [Firmicutes bacterium]|nr:hypothetical protein [Bacillota bacterium]